MELAASGKMKLGAIELSLDDSDLVETDNTDPTFTPPWLMETPRVVTMSLPSEYEIDSERKSSPPVLERRKRFTRFVASTVGVAWFICLVAVGQSALHAMIASLH